MKRIIAALNNKKKYINKTKVLLGFDGFIDNIIRVVKSRVDSSNYTLYKEIQEFSNYINNAVGKSCEAEIIIDESKIGGNAPIMANTLGVLGVKSVCIGAMGYPAIREQFEKMSSNCRLISIAEPSMTFAYEFKDGKVMFANTEVLDSVNWERVREEVGKNSLKELLEASQLVSLVNWSLLNNIEGIWTGLLEEILPSVKKKPRYFFFDLADPAKRSKEAIAEAVYLIEKFSKFTTTVLGLNENEARRVYGALSSGDERSLSIMDLTADINDLLNIDYIVVHPVSYSVAATGDKVYRRKGYKIENPKLTTGGGDNFNAGFCLGLLLDLSLRDSLTVGMATSSYYVKNGCSPNMSDLIKYMESLILK